MKKVNWLAPGVLLSPISAQGWPMIKYAGEKFANGGNWTNEKLENCDQIYVDNLDKQRGVGFYRNKKKVKNLLRPIFRPKNTIHLAIQDDH